MKYAPPLIFVAVLIVAAGAWWFFGARSIAPITTFEACAAAGNPVMESYPRQCRAGGQTFTEFVGNELEKSDRIRINTPRPNQTISSPLTVTGEARGNWYFEASFPVFLVDWDGRIIAQGVAQAKGDWMTTDFVPFEAVLTFTADKNAYSNKGSLILKKDNPSGLPQNDDALEIPVVYSGTWYFRDGLTLLRKVARFCYDPGHMEPDPVPAERIADKIYVIRGRKVMLDRDLAGLYGVKTHVLNQAVKRNAERFPPDFMFELSEDERKNLISQIVISSGDWGGSRKPPRAFTEQGVAMLSSALRSPKAIMVNIQIIRTFTRLRELLADNEHLRLKLEAMENAYDKKFKVVFDALRKLLAEPPSKTDEIGFKG